MRELHRSKLYRTTLIKVRDHLLKQGKRCTISVGEWHKAPVNHNSEGLSCSIGCLQTEKINDVLPFAKANTSSQPVIDAEFRALGFTQLDAYFLASLRRIHDDSRNGVHFKDDVIGLTRVLADRYELQL